MRPVSVNGRRSFFSETFLLPNLYNANKLPDLYLVVLSQPVLEIHMISCLSAAPQGRKSKGANCAALVCGGSRERSCCLPAVFRTAAIFCLSACFACPFLYLILSCLALPGSFLVLPYTSCPLFVPVCFLIFDLSDPMFFLPAGIACICRLLLFLV